MSLFNLLQERNVNVELCERISFEDAIRLYQAFGEQKFNCAIPVKDRIGTTLLFKEINPETIQLYNLSKDQTFSEMLTNAVIKEKRDIITFLLDSGLNIDVIDPKGYSALMTAAQYRRVKMESFLLERGADVNLGWQYGKSALITAAESGNLEIVNILLENGADINVGDDQGYNALSAAIYAVSSGKGPLELLQILIWKGATVNITDKFGNTTLMKAAEGGNKEVIKILLENGADINAVSASGNTVLKIVARYWSNEILQLLLDYGADINQGGYTALMSAIDFKRIETVRFLLDHGANINAVDDRGNTALSLALHAKNWTIINLLKEYGAH